MIPLKQGGIALSTSLVGILNFALLFFLLRRKIGLLGGRKLLKVSLEFVALSGLATLLAFGCFHFMALNKFGTGVALFSALIMGSIFYFGINYLRKNYR